MVTEGRLDLLEQLAKARRFWAGAIWISAGAVVVPPLLGLVGGAIGMARAFTLLGTTGAADPVALASDLSGALWAASLGILFSLLALGVLIVAIVRHRSARGAYRALRAE